MWVLWIGTAFVVLLIVIWIWLVIKADRTSEDAGARGPGV
jgi:hypothetical protein